MKILLITTGGTIGSVISKGTVDVSSELRLCVADNYISTHGNVDFDILSPLNILSESLSADDLSDLAQALLLADTAAYDGIIITAGSDNLAYIASFVGLLMCGCEKPVCVVASDKVLSDPSANGVDNFSCAVELIRRGEPGAFVPYRNSDKVVYVHSATDIRQADLSDDFYSFRRAYAVYKDGVFTENRPLIRQSMPAVFGAGSLPRISGGVLVIHPYPMRDYSRIDTDGVRAVLHTLYHSSTLDSRAVLNFKAEHGDIPLYLASFRSGRPLYSTARAVIDAGAIPLYDISPECAYMKLLFACAQEAMGIDEFMRCVS